MCKTLSLPALLLAATTASAGASGLTFSHKDWELVCDNTRTCRAAGYSSEYFEEAGGITPVSVLLTRKAGPGTPVTGELQLGSYLDEDDTLYKKLPPLLKLTMWIDRRPQGTVTISQKTLTAPLTAAQVTALVTALRGSSQIAWTLDRKHQWFLSGKGASAVLLKMDEYQGRLGTRSALVRKGPAGEEAVLPPLPMPVVKAVALPTDTSAVSFPPADTELLRKALLATLDPEEDECVPIRDGEGATPDFSFTRLAPGKLLVAVECWMAAYNSGHGYWVINAKSPYAPVKVTTMGTDFNGNTIGASHKGRGLGDCWNSDDWTWDGQRFVHSGSASTGMCRLVAPGGAWHLPQLVTRMVPASR